MELVLKIVVPDRAVTALNGQGSVIRLVKQAVETDLPSASITIWDGASVKVSSKAGRPILRSPATKRGSRSYFVTGASGRDAYSTACARVESIGVLLNRPNQPDFLRAYGHRIFLQDSLTRLAKADEVIACPGWQSDRVASFQVFVASMIGTPIN